ncbi:MAG: NADH-quinone oxidoreductase subunit L [Campylobacteraceae bacterium]|jgi:NADH-quinone oxidoreductase subunit L|nr:NADH-quinone oxidoreductase subunit L [Campylobacteraceae bacterium]MBT3881886.1 NADH-quinone oxidoreductase subunit L [Campylobacteraceae bacterium]MBT4029889.1 NADH-quinone oxidoreductase subunit L [Campylobacteraceae bacterium]MBT4178955.1 NADH-quinone oxidoreductase subunit L [Campylobacteraceae bacterium]MBT4573046.1 NADH-quinone oxidoreductase subunit L [Campylobacteraceae bacterium]
MEGFLYTALFAPLVGSLIAALFGNSPKKLFVGLITSGLLATAMIASLILLMHVFSTEHTIHVTMMDWIVIGNVNIPFGFVVDQVSVVMMVVVTIVSTMVHIHSIGYMDHDKGFNRFFSYLSAFVFSMMILVMSDNFAGLFIGWEGVGLCSWLLIGFWYHKEDKEVVDDMYNSPYSTLSPHSSISPGYAANEAFIMNRVADLGMLVGIFLIFWNIGSLQYDVVFAEIGNLGHGLIVAIAIFLFIGAMGKSAQFPFNAWLANAMEGPTPVSALIHAATMVTAGVYLVIRANEIFVVVPEVGYFIASLGAFVAIGAATMALVATNMKKIIAYSTLSQLGYMFVAAGLGAYWVALFHLATHAFFKSVLFLGAGNVMHAMNDEINIKKMGGLKKYMPHTALIMTVASVALAGIYPLAGFFSKDLILEVAFGSHAYILWLVLWITAGLTAFYSFRLVMYVFHGKENWSHDKEDDNYQHPHETYPFVIAAMAPLAILAVSAGWMEHSFVEMVTKVLPVLDIHVSTGTFWALVAVTSAIALSGIAFAVYKFNKDGQYYGEKMKDTFVYRLLANQYYIPYLMERVIIKPYLEMSKVSWKEVDLKIIDTFVDSVAKTIYNMGQGSRAMQTGNLSKALKWMTLGVVILLLAAAAAGNLK